MLLILLKNHDFYQPCYIVYVFETYTLHLTSHDVAIFPLTIKQQRLCHITKTMVQNIRYQTFWWWYPTRHGNLCSLSHVFPVVCSEHQSCAGTETVCGRCSPCHCLEMFSAPSKQSQKFCCMLLTTSVTNKPSHTISQYGNVCF